MVLSKTKMTQHQDCRAGSRCAWKIEPKKGWWLAGGISGFMTFRLRGLIPCGKLTEPID